MLKKFLLIDIRPRTKNRDNLIDISPLLLGSYTRKRFPELNTEIIDLGLENEDFVKSRELDSLIASADIIGLSCGTSIFYLDAKDFAKKCRSINSTVPIVVGGHHANILPQDFQKYPKWFDIVASGWGETAIQEVFTYLDRYNYARPSTPLHISGSPIPIGANSFDIDWTLLSKYFQSKTIKPIIYLKFARGCPQRCHFCSNSGAFRYQFQCSSPDAALSQLKGALNFVVKEGSGDPHEYLQDRTNLCLSDDLFGQNRAWRQKFLTKLIESRSTLPFNDFSLYVDERIDLFPQDDVELFDRARVNVAFGIESFDPQILTNMGKTRNPERFLRETDRILLHPQYSLKNTYYNIMLIFGFPSETPETLDRTENVLKNLSREIIRPIAIHGMFFGLVPSTEVYDNMSYYEKTFGSKFYYPNWWRVKNSYEYSIINKPSSQLPFLRLYDWVASQYSTIFENLYEKNFAAGAPDVFHSDLDRKRRFVEKCRRMHDFVNTLFPNGE